MKDRKYYVNLESQVYQLFDAIPPRFLCSINLRSLWIKEEFNDKISHQTFVNYFNSWKDITFPTEDQIEDDTVYFTGDPLLHENYEDGEGFIYEDGVA